MRGQAPRVLVTHGKDHVRELVNVYTLLGIDQSKRQGVLNKVSSLKVQLLVFTTVSRVPEELPLGVRKKLNFIVLTLSLPIFIQLAYVSFVFLFILESGPERRVLTSA